MKFTILQWRSIVPVIVLTAFAGACIAPLPAFAGNTGSITGTVRESNTGTPVANVKVTATAPSGSGSATTNAQGFYSINGLIPDTYTLSFQGTGYDPSTSPGIFVQQDQVLTVDQKLSKTLQVIGRVTTSSGNLVKPNVGTDVYNVSGAQLNAVTGADNLHKTLYEYLGTVPGVTINGGVGTPRIRGGDVHDIGYEFDGVPIRERMFGIFTTNLSNVGISNVEVYTGGLPASDAANGTGIINTVIKTGTYPPYGIVAYGATRPDRNNYLTLEYGGATPNKKLTYYGAFDGVNSLNAYNNGDNTFQDVLYGAFNGPGPVQTRDIIANLHYKPNPNNDVQFLFQNGIGDFNFNYLLAKPPGAPPNLALNPCPGSTVDPSGNSPTGNVGGVAPNGQPCPAGLYFGSLPSNFGNIWHHYSGIGKLQWNHIINDRSYIAFRLAENYNQYIFDQPLTDPNNPALQNPGGPYNLSPTCPTYPYAVGQPVAVNPKGVLCTEDIEDFYGDRSSHMYLGAFDYTNTVNAKLTLKFGAGQEYDVNNFSYFLRNSFNADGTWPNNYAVSTIPTHVPYVYGEATIHAGKFTLDPGLRYQRIYYGDPRGSFSVGLYNPTFSGTYRANENNVFRFSLGNSSDFIGSAYVYRNCVHLNCGPGVTTNPSYDPKKPGVSVSPQINHSADFMWEHQIDPNTSLRFGPWYSSANNYYESFKPVIGFLPSGKPKFGQPVKSNSAQHHALGLEFAFNHVDRKEYGISYWLSATYDNYWTTSLSGVTSVSPVVIPLPQNLIDQGLRVRDPNNPLLSATLTGDIHNGRFSIIPQVYYQESTYYNVGPNALQTGLIPQQIASGFFLVNTTVLERLNPKGSTIFGIRATNLTNTMHDTTPCFASNTGCYPFDGPQSGYNSPSSGYFLSQNITQSPQQFEFFFIQKF